MPPDTSRAYFLKQNYTCVILFLKMQKVAMNGSFWNVCVDTIAANVIKWFNLMQSAAAAADAAAAILTVTIFAASAAC